MAFPVNDSLDDLIESRSSIEQKIRQQAQAELDKLDARRALLLTLLGNDPYEHTIAENQAKAVSVPKYRDPATGKTWSGKGKRPRWFTNGQAELIENQDDSLAAAPNTD